MKYLFACFLIAAAVAVAISDAEATTCARRAATCQRLGGGGACMEPYRIATCQKTGIYTAPDGKAQEAKDR